MSDINTDEVIYIAIKKFNIREIGSYHFGNQESLNLLLQAKDSGN